MHVLWGDPGAARSEGKNTECTPKSRRQECNNEFLVIDVPVHPNASLILITFLLSSRLMPNPIDSSRRGQGI